MKDRLYRLLPAVCCVALVFSFVKINALENEIRNLKNTISATDRNLTSSISSIYANVDRQMKEQASLLYDEEYTVVSADGKDWDDNHGWYSGMEATEVYNPDGTLLYAVEIDDTLYK